MSVDGGEFHHAQDRYNLYVENCLKKDIKPLGPKQWSKREIDKIKSKQREEKEIVRAAKQEEDAAHTQQINIAFIIMMRENGNALNLSDRERAIHFYHLGIWETTTWNNNNPKPCPYCKNLLCPWAK